MASFVRWNENTHIWELAVNPDSPTTLFNHLPVANPTLPLDIANKQYVDSLVGGGPFVPYNGAVGDVNLGAFDLTASRIRAVNPINAGPTLGTYGNSAFSINANTVGNYGLNFGISATGDTWIQSQRFDGGLSTYNISLNPSGGNVLVGGDIRITKSTNPTLIIFDPTQPANSRRFNITNFGQKLFLQATDDGSTIEQGAVTINRAGGISASSSIYERGRGVPMGDWQSWTPAWKSYGGGADGVIGNGQLFGRYSIVGKTVYYTIQLVIGSTTVFPASYWAFILPLPAATTSLTGSIVSRSNATGQTFVGSVAPAAFFFGIANGIVMISFTPALSYQAYIDSSSPFVWGAGDVLWISGQYETT